MVFVLVKNKVEDYTKWRKIYDENKSTRIRGGMLSEKVYTSANDPTEIFLLFKWDSTINAKLFNQSDELKSLMKEAGVVTKPEIHFLEEAEQKMSSKPVMYPFETF